MTAFVGCRISHSHVYIHKDIYPHLYPVHRSSIGRIQGLGFGAHRDFRVRFRLPHLLFAIMV